MKLSEFRSALASDPAMAIAAMIKEQAEWNIRWMMATEPFPEEHPIVHGLRLWGKVEENNWQEYKQLSGSLIYENPALSYKHASIMGYVVPPEGITISFYADDPHWSWAGGDRIAITSVERNRFHWDGNWGHPPVEIPIDEPKTYEEVFGNKDKFYL